MSIRVTATDEQTGDTANRQLDDNPKPGNYILTCGPGTVLAHHQVYANGTEVLTLKYDAEAGRSPGIDTEGTR